MAGGVCVECGALFRAQNKWTLFRWETWMLNEKPEEMSNEKHADVMRSQGRGY